MNTSGFLYFVPKDACDQPIDLDDGVGADGPQYGKLAIDRLPPKLGELFTNFRDVPDKIIQHRCVGPEGIKGVLLAPKSTTGQSPPAVVYDASSQEWMKVDGGRYWIGFIKGSPPHPQWCIERGAVVHWTIDNLWSVGVYRSNDSERCDLPSTYTFDDNGEVKSAVSKGYQSFFDLAGKALDHLTEVNTLSEPQCVALAIKLLRLNYRIGTNEIRLMFEAGHEWLKSSTVQAILMTVCDFENVVEHIEQGADEEKKSEPAIGSEILTPGV